MRDKVTGDGERLHPLREGIFRGRRLPGPSALVNTLILLGSIFVMALLGLTARLTDTDGPPTLVDDLDS